MVNQIYITAEEIVPVYTNQFCSLFGTMNRQTMTARPNRKTNIRRKAEFTKQASMLCREHRIFREQKYVKLRNVINSLHLAPQKKKKERK